MAVASPAVEVGDVKGNVKEIIAVMEQANEQGVEGLLFPELSITGYSCADLFYETRLQEAALEGLQQIIQASMHIAAFVVVGLPVMHRDRLYNMAAFVSGGQLVGLVPKVFLPNTHEFYEQRWFTSGEVLEHEEITLTFLSGGAFEEGGGNAATASFIPIPVGRYLLFTSEDNPHLKVGVEICEDLWTVAPPSGDLALWGARLLLNPSASNELVGKAAYRRGLVQQQSARCLAAYAYVSCGAGESTTDTVYSGHSLIAENGRVLAEGARYGFESRLTIADVDLQLLANERVGNSSFSDSQSAEQILEVPFKTGGAAGRGVEEGGVLLRELSAQPFIPYYEGGQDEQAEEIFAIQTTGLAKRLKHIGLKKVVIGVSGGLDSSLALLVTAKAFDLLSLDRVGIVAVTMPGLGTTERTRNNAEELIDALGCEKRIIPIEKAVRQHFEDIGHDESDHDVTYENSQARERTQILMDLANKEGALVVGTGDLSEAALGWCTFNGDHMSNYHVSSGVPKTLVQFLIGWVAAREFGEKEAAILRDVIDTPITPELLPASAEGKVAQKTEESIGPYELHDFFLFYLLRHHFAPAKIHFLAERAFAGKYQSEEILKWMKVFYKRFFNSQFKRSSMPDGPKVGSVALSPRADWRMPSDAVYQTWLDELERI